MKTIDSKLRPFKKLLNEEILLPIDVEFCRFLQEIDSEITESVLLAACLTSAAYQNGDVCIVLNDYAGEKVFAETPAHLQLRAPSLQSWLDLLEESCVVGRPGDFKPLILDDANRLYFHRLWHFEQNLVQQIHKRLHQSAPGVDESLLNDGLNRLFNSENLKVNWQKVASAVAIHHLFTVISGGPGTGKTTTVVRFLALLFEQGRQRGSMPSVALAAPTGKAAARLQASILDTKSSLQTADEIKASIPVEAVTLHQLLGASRHTSRFRYNEENKLPHDCVIVDEASMVDQVLMNRLMDALRPETRLILLGDKDQLASVEAGSVLGDICGDMNRNIFSTAIKHLLAQYDIELPNETILPGVPALADHIILLKKSYRFGSESGIGRLAKATNNGDAEEVWSLLNDEQFPDVQIKDSENMRLYKELFEPVLEHFHKVQAAGNPEEMLQIYNEFKILAAHRRGPWGINSINNGIEQTLREQGLITPYEKWYKGRPVIINRNDYALGLSNGDLGVCVNEGNGFKICFATDEGSVKITPSRLPEFSIAYALTVHKSQGSEFGGVLLVLPNQPSPLLSRELLYTAVTRARKKVKILGTKAVIETATSKNIARNSGLQDYLWNEY